MDLIDRLKELATRIPKQLGHVKTEEATKNALIMPFIQALGYDIFNPTEVVPELTADVGTKKGEKVDYAIFQDGKPIILIECKASDVDLDKAHASQLYRYFSVTEARCGILTNGVDYKFFSDLEEPNKMDSRPFLEFSMSDLTDQIGAELKKFAKDAFDIEQVVSAASELKYLRGMRRALVDEWANPSDELVRLLTSRVYSGRMTHAVREQFTQIARQALHEFLNERVNSRLKSALDNTEQAEGPVDEVDEDESGSDIVTTDEEMEGFYIVKAIVSDVVDPDRVVMRDRKRYCAVLLDDTNRKPICRMWLNSPTKRYISLFDGEKNEEKVPIARPADLFKHAQVLRETVVRYDGTASGPGNDEVQQH